MKHFKRPLSEICTLKSFHECWPQGWLLLAKLRTKSRVGLTCYEQTGWKFKHKKKKVNLESSPYPHYPRSPPPTIYLFDLFFLSSSLSSPSFSQVSRIGQDRSRSQLPTVIRKCQPARVGRSKSVTSDTRARPDQSGPVGFFIMGLQSHNLKQESLCLSHIWSLWSHF